MKDRGGIVLAFYNPSLGKDTVNAAEEEEDGANAIYQYCCCWIGDAFGGWNEISIIR